MVYGSGHSVRQATDTSESYAVVRYEGAHSPDVNARVDVPEAPRWTSQRWRSRGRRDDAEGEEEVVDHRQLALMDATRNLTIVDISDEEEVVLPQTGGWSSAWEPSSWSSSWWYSGW